MKILKYIVALIILLLVLFFAKGMLSPSISYESEIIVDKPVEEAWAVMNDESKLSEWLTGITNMEHISGTKGEVGAVTQYTFVEDGQESVIVETMTEVKPNERAAMDFVMEGVMKMDYKIDFSERDGKTILKSSTTTTGEGMVMRSIVSFMKKSMKVQEDYNMNKLKELINKNTTNYFPTPIIETTETILEQ